MHRPQGDRAEAEELIRAEGAGTEVDRRGEERTRPEIEAPIGREIEDAAGHSSGAADCRET